jgi:hypothetical protein
VPHKAASQSSIHRYSAVPTRLDFSLARFAPASPTYAAYHVTEPAQKGRKARWTPIGPFFSHADGNGGTLIIEALPVAFDGRIVLRASKPL